MSTKNLLQAFSRAYKDKVGEPYPPTWGRDMKIFQRMLQDYPEARLLHLLELYFEQERDIYSIVFFKCAISDLIQLDTRSERDRPQKMPDNEQWRDL